MRHRVTFADLLGLVWFLALLAEVGWIEVGLIAGLWKTLHFWNIFLGLLLIVCGIPLVRRRFTRKR